MEKLPRAFYDRDTAQVAREDVAEIAEMHLPLDVPKVGTAIAKQRG